MPLADEIRSSELGSGCILSTLKFKRSSKNLKIALIFFPGSGFGKRCMLSGHWFAPHVIRFSELASLDAFYLCLVNVFLSIPIYFIVDCIVVLYEFALYLLHVYISIL